MLKLIPGKLATSNILVGTMITGSKSPTMAVNILLVAVTASSINTEISQPLTSTLNGNDRSPNLRRSKIDCENGSLRCYQRSSTFLVFKSLVGGWFWIREGRKLMQ